MEGPVPLAALRDLRRQGGAQQVAGERQSEENNPFGPEAARGGENLVPIERRSAHQLRDVGDHARPNSRACLACGHRAWEEVLGSQAGYLAALREGEGDQPLQRGSPSRGKEEAEDELRELEAATQDRYGPLPEPVENLFRIQEAKLKVARVGADYFVFRGGKASVGQMVLGSEELRDLRRHVDTSVYTRANHEVSLREESFPASLRLVDALQAVRAGNA